MVMQTVGLRMTTPGKQAFLVSSYVVFVPLLSWLVKLRIDSLILVGGSTSGCVRASAVDAVTRNFNVAVVEDCVYDRISISHAAGLLDMWMKYCDVMNSEEAAAYIRALGK